LITKPIAQTSKFLPSSQKASNREWLEALFYIWRERVGIEPAKDCITEIADSFEKFLGGN